MSSEPAELEPSPFPESDGDEPSAGAPRPWEPAQPLSQAELDHYGSLSWEVRTFNPWACMWNRNAEDGIGYYSGMGKRQCEILLADPTRSRYCLEHARQMGLDYYAPQELSEAVSKETATNLTRLVPKATATLEMVMDDSDAPPGIRAKAADSVLDRTGYAKGVNVQVDAQIATVDVTGVLKDRLDSLRDSIVERTAAEAGEDVVAGAIVVADGSDSSGDDRTTGPAGDGGDGGAA